MSFQSSQMHKTAGGYAVLSDETAARLRGYLREVGDDQAAQRFNVHKLTLVRAACQLEVLFSSAAHIDQRLTELTK